jgi:hypothetical protein
MFAFEFTPPLGKPLTAQEIKILNVTFYECIMAQLASRYIDNKKTLQNALISCMQHTPSTVNEKKVITELQNILDGTSLYVTIQDVHKKQETIAALFRQMVQKILNQINDLSKDTLSIFKIQKQIIIALILCYPQITIPQLVTTVTQADSNPEILARLWRLTHRNYLHFLALCLNEGQMSLPDLLTLDAAHYDILLKNKDAIQTCILHGEVKVKDLIALQNPLKIFLLDSVVDFEFTEKKEKLNWSAWLPQLQEEKNITRLHTLVYLMCHGYQLSDITDIKNFNQNQLLGIMEGLLIYQVKELTRYNFMQNPWLRKAAKEFNQEKNQFKPLHTWQQATNQPFTKNHLEVFTLLIEKEMASNREGQKKRKKVLNYAASALHKIAGLDAWQVYQALTAPHKRSIFAEPDYNKQPAVKEHDFKQQALLRLHPRLNKNMLDQWRGIHFTIAHRDALIYLILIKKYAPPTAVQEISDLSPSQANALTTDILNREEILRLKNPFKILAYIELYPALSIETLKCLDIDYFSFDHLYTLIFFVRKHPDKKIEEVFQFLAWQINNNSVHHNGVASHEDERINLDEYRLVKSNLHNHFQLFAVEQNLVNICDFTTHWQGQNFFYYNHYLALKYLIKKCGWSVENAFAKLYELDFHQVNNLIQGRGLWQQAELAVMPQLQEIKGLDAAASLQNQEVMAAPVEKRQKIK